MEKLENLCRSGSHNYKTNGEQISLIEVMVQFLCMLLVVFRPFFKIWLKNVQKLLFLLLL